MGIVIFEEEPLLFHINCFTNTKKQYFYEIEALNAATKKLWTKEIERRLWQQLKMCRGWIIFSCI